MIFDSSFSKIDFPFLSKMYSFFGRRWSDIIVKIFFAVFKKLVFLLCLMAVQLSALLR